jgi:hypothetical protein
MSLGLLPLNYIGSRGGSVDIVKKYGFRVRLIVLLFPTEGRILSLLLSFQTNSGKHLAFYSVATG